MIIRIRGAWRVKGNLVEGWRVEGRGTKSAPGSPEMSGVGIKRSRELAAWD
jgi:hypothetical protein